MPHALGSEYERLTPQEDRALHRLMPENAPCVACAQTEDDDLMTTCDECDRSLCGFCAHSLSGEDVVCPDCYRATVAASRSGDGLATVPDPPRTRED